MPFHVTSAAAQEVLAAAGRSGAAGMALRVAAKHTAEGIAYGMGFDDAAPDDEVAVFDGLTVLIAEPSRPLLAQTVLDYVELDAGGRDFIFVPLEQRQGSSRTAAPAGCAGGGCRGCG